MLEIGQGINIPIILTLTWSAFMKEQDLIYAAGLMDGEGTITLTKTSKASQFRYPVVSITSTSLELLEFMKSNFKGHISNQKTYKEHHKKSWSWAVTGDAAIDFLKHASVYMKETRKLIRASMIVNQYKTLTLRNGRYTPEQKQAKLDFETAFLSS
jgi:hypothetical protein